MIGNSVTDIDLQAYADGQLAEDRRAAVEAHLAQNPRLAGEVADWQRQNETLRALYGHVGREEPPPRLSVHAIERGMRDRTRQSWRMAAAAVVLLTAGAFGGWFAREALTGESTVNSLLVSEAVAAHSLYVPEVVHPVEVKADQQAHMTRWLSKRLDRTLNIPDLASEGLTLVGGRLLPANSGPAAQVMYEDGSGKRVTLFIVPAPHGTELSLRHAALDSLQSFVWTDEAISCAIVADLPRDRLQAIAVEAYKQLG